MSSRTLATTLIGAIAPISLAADARDPLPALRGALGWQSPRGDRPARVEARVRHLDGDGRATIVASPRGDLLLRIAAPLPEVFWAEGPRGTASDWTGMPRPLEGHDLEVARLLASVLTGTWLSPDSAVAVGPAEPGAKAIPVRVRGGRLEARLLLDEARLRPAAFEVETLSGTERLELEFGRGPAPWVPARVRHSLGELPIGDYERSTVGHGSSAAALGLRAPDFAIPKDTTFEGAGRPVRAMRAKTGHTLVEVEVDETAGWFILDTGASATVVAGGWPREGLPRLGSAPLASAYGVSRSAVRRAAALRVGPVAIRDLPVIEMDLAFLSGPLGQSVSGIIGYDLFSRVLARVEPAAAAVSLEPASASPVSEPWIPFRFEAKLPVVEGRWEGDRVGLFRLDLGAGPAVIFHWPAVERYRLLEGRSGKRVPAGADTLVMDSIDWFELGAVRTGSVTAFFAERPEGGILKDRHTDGNVGLGILDRYRIVLDYRRTRLALVPRSGAAGATPTH